MSVGSESCCDAWQALRRCNTSVTPLPSRGLVASTLPRSKHAGKCWEVKAYAAGRRTGGPGRGGGAVDATHLYVLGERQDRYCYVVDADRFSP